MRMKLMLAMIAATLTLGLAGCSGGDKVVMSTNQITASEAGDNKSPYQSYDQPKINKTDGGNSGSGSGSGGGYPGKGGPPRK